MKAEVKRLVARVRAVLEAHGRAVWNRDRAQLQGPADLGNRVLRIAILVVRGISRHRLGVQSAALTFYTVFSIVPVLVVSIWIMKELGYLPSIMPDLPAAAANLPDGNAILRASVRKLLETVERTSKVTGGIIGLAALFYAVVRLFFHMERALDAIAVSDHRRAKLSRLFGYVAFLIVPPLIVLTAGLLVGPARGATGSTVSQLASSFHGHKLAVTGSAGLFATWLALSILYSAAARARIAFSSAAIGGFVASLLLPMVFLLFAKFQIGVSRSDALQGGAAAGPVFLLWAYTSWFVVLIGAEIAVAHEVEKILIHGARTFRLDALGEQETGVAIMVRVARAAQSGNRPLTADGLARDIRLPPHLVRVICLRLAHRGLLRSPEPGVFVLASDPHRIDVADVADAIARDPGLDQTRMAATEALGTLAGSAITTAAVNPWVVTSPVPTLGELAGEPGSPPAQGSTHS